MFYSRSLWILHEISSNCGQVLLIIHLKFTKKISRKLPEFLKIFSPIFSSSGPQSRQTIIHECRVYIIYCWNTLYKVISVIGLEYALTIRDFAHCKLRQVEPWDVRPSWAGMSGFSFTLDVEPSQPILSVLKKILLTLREISFCIFTQFLREFHLFKKQNRQFLTEFHWNTPVVIYTLVHSSIYKSWKNIWGSLPWPPLVTGLISDILANSTVGEI